MLMKSLTAARMLAWTGPEGTAFARQVLNMSRIAPNPTPNSLRAQLHAAAWSSTAAPTTEPLAEAHHRHVDFHRYADIYLGGLWNRFEAGLREQEGEDFDYGVELTAGCMRVSLPDSAAIIICKDPEEKALKVESNLHDLRGGGDPRDVAAFRLSEEGDFSDGGTSLHEYLEDHMAKHLKVQMDLDPLSTKAPNDTVDSPDPT